MLSLSLPAIAGFSVLLLAIYKFIIYPSILSPLSRVPNAHWSASVSPVRILWIRFRCRENRTLHAAHLKHGGVVRVGPNELSVNDIASVRKIYTGGFEKGQWYSIFDNYGVPCIFSSHHSRTHSPRKRMISNTYSKSSIQTSRAAERQGEVILYGRLIPIIDAAAKSSEGIDVHDVWNATAMDFICAYLFGLKNGSNFLEDAEYRRHWLSLYHSRKTYPYFSQELPRLTKFLKRFGIHLVPAWVDDANDELEAWTKARCDDSFAYLKKEAANDSDIGNLPVVLCALMAGIEKESKVKGDQSVLSCTTLANPELSIASEMIDNLAAGHETSGITLTYLSWELSRNLALQKRLCAELLTLSPDMTPGCAEPSSSLPNSKELDALPILHAVLMETLRLHAAIPGGQPRMAPYPSCSLGGYTIPGGVRVSAQAHSLHRNAEVYPEPEKFDCTRWLDDENGYTPEQSKERDRWFWAFSSGGRMCVGSNFAMHEIKLVIAAVYTNYRTYIVDDNGIEQEDGYTVGPASNKLMLRFEKL
ncbi:cytochrome P450 [Calycina marina]|uniref:Cytochrome P450 n=1 Tax=Calycina marina TaxID=1763456 RepID=A0A9P7Z690_9HELO|nr:cytochrome P450 [Calycina marina]